MRLFFLLFLRWWLVINWIVLSLFRHKLRHKNTQLESNRVELKRGVYSDLTLQPWQAQSEEQTQLLRDLFEGLTAYDVQGNLVPAVAENWQTEDNKTWIFTLRENAKWSNGEPITASDFVQSWQTLSQSESPLKIIWLL